MGRPKTCQRSFWTSPYVIPDCWAIKASKIIFHPNSCSLSIFHLTLAFSFPRAMAMIPKKEKEKGWVMVSRNSISPIWIQKKQLFYFPTPSKSKSFYNIPWVLILWFKESQKQILKLQSCFSNLLLFTNFISIGFLYRNVFIFLIINWKLSI